MKIRVISDLHLDVNDGYAFSLKQQEKDIFAIIPGDVSGNVKLTAKWVKQNIHNGILVAGNHDPTYNDSGLTIRAQKEFLHEQFPLDGNVTFMDEQVGVMEKTIPGTNIVVIGSTLYTDYRYASEDIHHYLDRMNSEGSVFKEKKISVQDYNMEQASRGLNDFRWGHVEDEFDDRGLSQRRVRPDDYLKWFRTTLQKISDLVEMNADKEVIVVTHHCPTPKCISTQYLEDTMNASYISDLEKFITDRPSIKAWCCGHVHSPSFHEIGDRKQLIVCNPRGYESHFETEKWNPNTFIDTDTWKVVTEPWTPSKKLAEKRRLARDKFMKYAPLFFC